MNKKAICLFLAVSSLLCLTGCWNYRGLNEMTIIAGVALDKKDQSEGYRLTFEFIDTSTPIKDKGPQGKRLESEGQTIFDAVRNAKTKVSNKLYFGHTQTIIISEELARSEDITAVLDIFLRDDEFRDTMCVAIAQEDTAAAILKSEGIDQAIVSNEMHKILQSDAKTTASTILVEVYHIFDTVRSPGKALSLSAIQCVEVDETTAPESNGIAVFRGERLAGFLSPEESKYYHFIMNTVQGGVLPISSSGSGPIDTSLEISSSKTKRDFSWEDGKAVIHLSIDAKTYLGEYLEIGVDLDKDAVEEIKNNAEKELENRIKQLVYKVQSEYQSDIFAFGNLIYMKDLQLWKQLEPSWDEIFPSVEVDVEVNIRIASTASLKKT